MDTRLQAAIALALIGLAATAVTDKAQACGLTNMQRYAGQHWSMPAYLPGSSLAVAAAAPKASASYFNPLRSLEPIAGFYRFTFTAEGNPGGPPNGTTIDQGFVTWHADGTEIMNSGRPAYSGNFCMGAWVRTGANSYRLNHYALAWDLVNGQTFVGPVNIHEYVNLAPGGNSYSGNFTLDQYAPNGTTLLAHVQGTIAATRITANSN
ncbi:MAG TPA: hypothetical protein VFP88_07905 [Rhodanobacteraceae bacterium]|nr:hypothetical protein [Rhodanobacteraceae bacterium]